MSNEIWKGPSFLVYLGSIGVYLMSLNEISTNVSIKPKFIASIWRGIAQCKHCAAKIFLMDAISGLISIANKLNELTIECSVSSA